MFLRYKVNQVLLQEVNKQQQGMVMGMLMMTEGMKIK
jgi:hypothetical protein